METFIILIILGLFMMVILAFLAGKALGKRIMFELMQAVIKKEREDAVKKSRSVLSGQFSEQLAPFFPNFPAATTECKFIGAPIDFIAFRGLDEKNVEEIIFIEVKTGRSKMNNVQKTIKEAIENNRVRFEEYRIN